MTWRFEVAAAPDVAARASVAASAPTNAFLTPEYARAREALGFTTYAIGIRRQSDFVGAYAFARGRRMISLALEVQSLPTLPDDGADAFWAGVLQLARSLGVWDLSLQSFGSEAAHIPALSPRMERRPRCEFVIDLSTPAGVPRPATNHLRNAAKAKKAGLVVRRTRDPGAAEQHVRLVHASMQRRFDRGEQVSVHQESASTRALLQSGAAELLQAFDGDALRSSLCLLRGKAGAYYQTAGTSPEGMGQGASHFLILEIMKLLADEGMRTFNMGGAGPESTGLRRFKEGFQPRAVELEAASLCLKPAIQRQLREVVRGLRRVTAGS